MRSYGSATQTRGFLMTEHAPGEYSKIPAGHYKFQYDQERDSVYFKNIDFNVDKIVDLPTKEFQKLTEEFETFLKSETKKLYKDYGFVYKRSTLVYGVPGTGKSVLTSRIAREVVERGGVVLYDPNIYFLDRAVKAINDMDPSQTVLVVLEEIDSVISMDPRAEPYLLKLLDGQAQLNNIIYLATTNYLEKVPVRLLRPGRMSSVIEITFPDRDCRAFYLNTLFPNLDVKLKTKIIEYSDNFSVDELKEMVLCVTCLGQTPEYIRDKIGKIKNLEVDKKDDNSDTVKLVNEFRKSLEAGARYEVPVVGVDTYE
jgi:SpoVK/Ycf46/Vps4 family AAA+-type ATPase